MDTNWIVTNLKDSLDPTGQNVILLSNDAGTHSISVANLAAMFSGVSTVTYATLSATPQAKGGWQAYFDDWKARGIIS